MDGYAVVALGRRRLRPATVALYDRLLRLAILPAFGGRELRDITSAEVTAWYGSMKRTPTQQANAYGLLKSILKDAVDDGLIATNPCRVKAGAQKTRAREIEVLTVGQLEAYLAALGRINRELRGMGDHDRDSDDPDGWGGAHPEADVDRGHP